VGLVTRARTAQEVTTYAGTPDYMPPPPEPPGTKLADIYALGMVLYVISTGREPAYFPQLKTTLVMNEKQADFMFLNPVILKACHADITQRYGSAADLRAALQAAKQALEQLRQNKNADHR
jgi:serine/threonine protein kinase